MIDGWQFSVLCYSIFCEQVKVIFRKLKFSPNLVGLFLDVVGFTSIFGWIEVKLELNSTSITPAHVD